MSASSICNTNPRQLSSPHQPATLSGPDLCSHNPSMLICKPSPPPPPPPLPPTPLSLSRAPPPDQAVSSRLVVFTPSFSVLSFLSLPLPCHPVYLVSSSLTSLLSPSILPYLLLSPPTLPLPLSLIPLCGGFAVGSPRHERSISRSPGGSGPYNSVQWAWIVSQSTQDNLSVNILILWAASFQCKAVSSWTGARKRKQPAPVHWSETF